MTAVGESALKSLADARRRLTGEPYQTARMEIVAHAERGPLPGAVDADQEMLEALVLSALIAEFGHHKIEEHGGPFGIRAATPRPHELVLRVERSQLGRFAAALVPEREGDGQGVPGLGWSSDGREVVLARAQRRGRIVLARTFAHDWERFAHRAAANPDTMTWPEQAEIVRRAEARISGCAFELSACLRRIALLAQIAGRHTHGGALHYDVASDPDGSARLLDLISWGEKGAPPWLTSHTPRRMWPTPRRPAQPAVPVAEAVVALAALADPAAAGPEAALCAIAGLRPDATALATAAHALAVAERHLDKPANAYLFAEGGWAANRRRAAEDFLGRSGPVDPPGTDEMLAARELDLTALRRNTERPGARPTDRTAERRGKQLAVELLDWALTAATTPGTPRFAWTRSTPTAPDPGQISRSTSRWTASLPLPDGSIPLHLQVDLVGPGAYRYRVNPGPDGVPAHVHHANPALYFGTEYSLPAALLVAENAAQEAFAAAAHLRTSDRRLLLPDPVDPQACPALADLIMWADQPDDILDLYTLVGRLAAVADRERRIGTPATYAGPADGHWGRGRSGYPEEPEIRTLTADLSDDECLPSTHPGEQANSSPVDAPAFRRHLAAHRWAIDPFAECYLAAADAYCDRSATFAARHRAGVQALRAADSAGLAALDPQPAGARGDVAWAARTIPHDVERLAGFWADWRRQRDPDAGH